MFLPKLITVTFLRIHHSSRTRSKGMELYKKQYNIDAKHQFFSKRVVDTWNSLPKAVVLSPV